MEHSFAAMYRMSNFPGMGTTKISGLARYLYALKGIVTCVILYEWNVLLHESNERLTVSNKVRDEVPNEG